MTQKLTTEEKILLEHAHICIGKLPTSYNEMNRMLWDAFDRGRRYEMTTNPVLPISNYIPKALKAIT